MGQYYQLLNKNREEKLDIRQLGSNLKALEIASGQVPGVFLYLLADIDGFGEENAGRWSGGGASFVGDYDSSKLYQEAKGYNDITSTVEEDVGVDKSKKHRWDNEVLFDISNDIHLDSRLGELAIVNHDLEEKIVPREIRNPDSVKDVVTSDVAKLVHYLSTNSDSGGGGDFKCREGKGRWSMDDLAFEFNSPSHYTDITMESVVWYDKAVDILEEEIFPKLYIKNSVEDCIYAEKEGHFSDIDCFCRVSDVHVELVKVNLAKNTVYTGEDKLRKIGRVVDCREVPSELSNPVAAEAL